MPRFIRANVSISTINDPRQITMTLQTFSALSYIHQRFHCCARRCSLPSNNERCVLKFKFSRVFCHYAIPRASILYAWRAEIDRSNDIRARRFFISTETNRVHGTFANLDLSHSFTRSASSRALWNVASAIYHQTASRRAPSALPLRNCRAAL